MNERYLPGKICKFHLQIFLTGKYKATEKIKDFSVAEKRSALRAMGLGIINRSMVSIKIRKNDYEGF
jgi:hypothetical protein